MGVDSSTKVTVWPPELVPDVATAESDESRRGVKYVGPGDRRTPGLPNLIQHRYHLKVGTHFRRANVKIVPVWKHMSLCALMDSGHDVFFTHDAGVCHAIHTNT